MQATGLQRKWTIKWHSRTALSLPVIFIFACFLLFTYLLLNITCTKYWIPLQHSIHIYINGTWMYLLFYHKQFFFLFPSSSPSYILSLCLFLCLSFSASLTPSLHILDSLSSFSLWKYVIFSESISLHVMTSSSIHVSETDVILFFLISSHPLHMCNTLSLSIVRYSDWFHYLAVMNSAMVNMDIQVSIVGWSWSFMCMPTSSLAGSHCNVSLGFEGTYHIPTILYKCSLLHEPCQGFPCFVSSKTIILTRVRI